jgi:ATP-binding cassette subfamily B protein
MEKLTSSKDIFIWLYNTWKGYKLQTIINIAIGILLVFTDLAFVWGTKLCIDIATHNNTRFSLKSAITLLIILLITQLLLSYASKWVKATLGAKSTCQMQKDNYRHLLQCDWSALKQYHSGDILNRLEKDIDSIVTFLTESIPSLLATVTRLIGAFLILYIMNKTLALIIIIICPLFLIISKLYVKKTRLITHDIRTSESKIQTTIQEGLQHITVLKTFGKTLWATEILNETQNNLKKGIKNKTIYSSISSLTMNFGFSAGYIITFTWGVLNLENGIITYGALIAFMQLIGQIQAPIRNLSRYIPIFINAFTASERIIELQAIKQEKLFYKPLLKGDVGIELKNVTFQYPKGRHIFENFSYNFTPHSKTAIVGETGKGKTTLIRLVLSLLHPQKGCIEIYNKTTRLSLTNLSRNNFSYVPQGNTLLNGTIKSNLILGNEYATETDMVNALTAACANFVFNSEKGLDMPCGEGGNGLSEGQAQRISIARALLKPCSILIMDEATSSLDEDTEKNVIKNITNLYPEKTIIFITHRPEILKYCTHVLHL